MFHSTNYFEFFEPCTRHEQIEKNVLTFSKRKQDLEYTNHFLTLGRNLSRICRAMFLQ